MDNRVFHENAVVIPATLGANAEIFSEVYHSNAQTQGEVFVSVPNVAKIGTGAGNLVVTVYGSADGETFINEGNVTIAYNATPAAATGVALAYFAPYFKVGVKSTATGGLQSGHAIKVDAVVVEQFAKYKRDYEQIASISDATETATISVPQAFESVYITTFDVSGTVSDFDYDVYTSNDNVTWYKVYTKANLVKANFPATSIINGVGLMKYVKIDPTAIAGGVVAVGMYGIGY